MACEQGQILRKSYTRKGKRVKSKCIRKVTPYDEKFSDFQAKQRKRMTVRLRGVGKVKRGNTTKCGPGELLRKAYVRYTATGKRLLIKGACITKRGSGVNPGIGPLRKGELSQFGYVKIGDLSVKKRHDALKGAVAKYGSLSVWKKINVLFIFTKNTNPTLSAMYDADRHWIQETFGLKAF